MRYEEPNMQILMMNDEDVIRTSSPNVTFDPNKFPTGDSGAFPTRP